MMILMKEKVNKKLKNCFQIQKYLQSIILFSRRTIHFPNKTLTNQNSISLFFERQTTLLRSCFGTVRITRHPCLTRYRYKIYPYIPRYRCTVLKTRPGYWPLLCTNQRGPGQYIYTDKQALGNVPITRPSLYP